MVCLHKLIKGGKEKLTKHEKKAIYSLGAYVAGAALAMVPPGNVIAGLGAIGSSWTSHIGVKAVDHLLDEGLLHYEWIETIMHGVHVIAADKSEVSDDEVVARLTGHVFDALGKGVGDDDMEKILKGA